MSFFVLKLFSYFIMKCDLLFFNKLQLANDAQNQVDNPRVYRDLPLPQKKNESISALAELSQLCLDTDETDSENQTQTASSPLLLDL